MARYGRRKIKEPDFREGLRTAVGLDTLNVVKDYELRADYGITVAGGTGAGAPYSDAAGRVVEELRLLMQVRGTTVPFFRMRGRDNLLIQELFRRSPLPQKPPADDATEAGLYSTFWLPMSVPAAIGDTGDVTALPTSRSESPTLEVQTGRAADVFAAEDGTPSFDGTSRYTLTERPILDGDPRGRFGHFWDYVEREITADAAGLLIDLPQMEPGDELVRVIVVAEEDGVRSDAILTEIGLEVNGATIFQPLPPAIYQDANQSDYQLASRKTGVVVWDFAEDGRIDPGQLAIVSRTRGHGVRVDATKAAGTCHVRVLAEWVRGRIRAGR